MADEPKSLTTTIERAIPLVAYAYSAGIAGAEEVGRELEQLLAATPQADRRAIKLLVGAGFVTEEKANEALNIAHGFQPGPLAATPQAEPDTDSADFKEGFALGRAESEYLIATIRNPACGLCGATCAKDAEAKCRSGGDTCPGVEWPLADLWALQQPATPQAAQVPDDAMVERALKVLAFEDDGAVFPDAYSDDEAEYERAKMRRVLDAALAAAQAQGVQS